MHARIDQLLSLRDGEPAAADVLRHVEECTACGAELRRLQQLQQHMQALPLIDAPASAWERIRVGAAGRPGVAPPRRHFTVAAAAVAVLAVLIALTVREDGSSGLPGEPTALVEVTAETPFKEVAALVAQSRELDDLLQTLPPRPSIERVATTATVDGLEARVQLVDLQLSYGSDDGLDAEQARRLWRERVDLMDSLIKVRYAEAGQISF